MKNSCTFRSFLVILVQTCTLLISGRLQAQSYTIVDLGSNSWSYSEAHGMNGSGSVTGEYEPASSPDVFGFLYRQGVMTDLGHLSGPPYTVGYAVNDSNQVAGESGGNTTHAFLYSNGTMTDLGTLGGNSGSYSSAHGINRAGNVVGTSTIAQAGVLHAVLYSGTSKTDLGALGGDYSNANAINNSNVIVGESDVVLGGVTNVHAFIYTNGSMTDLGTLGGGYSSAKAVNDSGIIVGESEVVVTGGSTNLHAFVYRNGAMSNLGTLGGITSSASSINSAGQIVGYSTDTNEVSNAFLYSGSTMVNLSDFIPSGSGWTNLSSADAINDAGQIAGSGFLADGSFHGYLLTPSSLPGPIRLLNPTFQGTSFSFTFATQSGFNYEGQAATSLASTNSWVTFTNVPGTGSSGRMTDPNATDSQKFYRVLAH